MTASPFKFASLVVLISGLCTSCTLSNYFNTGERQAIDVESAEKQIAARKTALQMQERLMELSSNFPLHADVIKVYSALNYQPIWLDETLNQQFLAEYAAFVASGVSANSAKILQKIDEVAAQQALSYDILLTEAWLDYVYYLDNLAASAQNWLYSVNRYKRMPWSEARLNDWIANVQAQQHSDWAQRVFSNNHLYRQSLEKLAAELKQNDPNKIKDLYKLAINAQRLLVIPNFDNGIFVNIPSYQLAYYRDGKLVLNSPVIVGKKARRTPVMQSKLSNVVVNPPWNVPNTILTQDIVPKLANDPSYAANSSLEIFDSNGNKISAHDVDWSQYAGSRSVPFRIRQKAGDDSALGRFKFNMPSSDAIYLHDTPNHNLFNKKSRALSSGCVRVAKSDELATILLQEAGWSLERKQNTLASKRTVSVQIQSDNPVYLYYVTIWVDKGEIHQLPDIYGYDNVKIPNYINWQLIQKYLL